MGHTNENLLKGFSGRVGNVVGYYRNGKYYLRAAPSQMKHPDTPQQLAQRMRFRLILEFLSPFSNFLRIGFGAYATGRTAFNAAMAYNLRHAISGSYPDLTVDPAKVRISQGLLPAGDEVNLSVSNNTLHFTWQNSGKGNSGDKVITVTACRELRSVSWLFNQAARKDGSAVMPMPSCIENKAIDGYLCFYNEQILTNHLRAEFISESCFAGSLLFS